MAKRKHSESSICDTNDTEEEYSIPKKIKKSDTEYNIPFSNEQSSSCDLGLSPILERTLDCSLFVERKDVTKIQKEFEEFNNQMKLQQCKEDDLDSTGTMMIPKRNTVDGLQSPASSIPLTPSNTSKVSPNLPSVQSCLKESSGYTCAQKLQFDLTDKHLLRKYIQWNYIHLKQNLEPDGIADRLLEFDVMNDAERNKIREAGYQYIKSDILLKFLVRNLEKMPIGDNTFIEKIFVAFEEEKCEYLLNGFTDVKYQDKVETSARTVPDIWKEKLSEFERKKGDELDAKQIIDKLLQKEVLEFDEHENIQDMKFKPDKLKYLIKYIQNKTSREFYNFVHVLEEEYPHICNDLKGFEIMDISISTDKVSSSVSIMPKNIKTSNSEGYAKVSELQLSLPPNGHDIEKMVVDSCENENNHAVTEEMMELGATDVLKYEFACIRLTLMHLSTRSKMQIYSKLQESPEKFSNILKHLFTHEHFRMMKERNIHSIDFRLEMAWPDAIITRDVLAEHYCFLKDKIEPNYFVDLLKSTNAPQDVIDAMKDMQKSRPSRCTQFLLFLVNDENSPIDMFHAKLKELKMDDVINVLMSSSKQISNRLCSCRLTKSVIVKHFSQLVQEMKDVDGLLETFAHFSGFDKSIKKGFEELRRNDKQTSNDIQKQSSNNEQNKAQMFLCKILDMSENEASEGVCLLEEEIRKTEQGEMLLKRVLEKQFKTEECAIMMTRNDIKQNRSFLRSQLEPRRFLDMLRDIDGIDEEREKISSQLPKQTRCDIFLGLLENHKVALEKFGPALKRLRLTKIIQFLYDARTQGSEEYKITKGDIERNSGFLQEELEPRNFLNMLRGIKGTDEDIENILSSSPRRIRCLRFYNILLKASEIDLEKFEFELKQRHMPHVIAFLINSRPGRYHDTTHIKEALADSYKCVIDEIEPSSLQTIFLEREVYTKEEFEEICSQTSRRARAINLMQDIMKGPVSKSRCLMNSLDAVGYVSLVKMIRKEIDAFKTCPRLFKKTHGITDCCIIEGQFEIAKIHEKCSSPDESIPLPSQTIQTDDYVKEWLLKMHQNKENDSKHVNRSVDVAFDCNKMDKNASLKHNCMKKSIDSNTPPHCIRQTCSWQENLSLDNQSCHRLDETASVFSKDTRSPSSCILNKAKSKKGAGSTSTASTIIYSDMNNTDVNDESNQ